jgi:hypothetical protein
LTAHCVQAPALLPSWSSIDWRTSPKM